jgi:hypothetical protein
VILDPGCEQKTCTMGHMLARTELVTRGASHACIAGHQPAGRALLCIYASKGGALAAKPEHQSRTLSAIAA